MPLNQSCSLEAWRENIAAEIRAGKPRNQAIAIASDTLERVCKASGQDVPRTDSCEVAVRRYDLGEFRAPTRTPNGYLRCDSRITRVGVFVYENADGTTRRELRLPDEVFRPDSLATFDLVPLTNGHPKEPLNAKNTRRYSAGVVQRIRQDDTFVGAEVLIMDEQAIEAALEGKTALSCGYNCDVEPTPGVTSGIPGVPDGLHYDFIQRNITGNHVAIVHRTRAGSGVGLHLDGQDAKQVDIRKPTGPAPGPVGGHLLMSKITIDGAEYELPKEAHDKLNEVLTRLDERVKTLEGEVATAKARADAAEEALTTERKDTAERYSPDAMKATVAARVALERNAASVLRNDELKLTEMSDDELRRAVVIKVSPAAKDRLDGADAAYVAARYDAAMEAWREAEAAKPTATDKAVAAVKAPATERKDARSARQAMLDGLYKMGIDPICATQKP